ncbi:Ribose import ATP-binding protein RbsA [Planctomycetes bacterium MalM25]|nr:Ribose import ATP-binding protein RbsA [Planctomycetes bacterium MalM25]
MPSLDGTGSLLRMEGVSKTFPGVKALDRVDFELRSGEVHALMGENGAGKSTLIKVLTGVHRADQGRILMEGDPISPHSPLDAQAAGISTVFQEVPLIPQLSVAENIMLGRQATRMGLLSWKSLYASAKKAIGRIDLRIDLHRELGSYSTAIQQMVAIARALDMKAKVLVLDEPTSSLDENEVEELLRVMRGLKNQGLGMVFVTHFLDQVYAIADRITVLRNGRHVETQSTQDLPRRELIAKMLGRQPEASAIAPPSRTAMQDESSDNEWVLEAKHLGRDGQIKPYDLRIGKGEVLGFAGLLGSGRTEAARLLFGLDHANHGELHVSGERLTSPTPARAIRAGLAFCPEDRKREGVLLDLSVRENILLAMQAHRGLARALPRGKQSEIANHYISKLRIKTPSPETPVGNLSGGNQQKVLLARWLAMQPKLIILDEPTRGIDVGAKAEIESLVASLREEGMAILFISSELEEVVRTCERVAVLRDRQVIGELEDDGVQETAIMDLIAGSHDT